MFLGMQSEDYCTRWVAPFSGHLFQLLFVGESTGFLCSHVWDLTPLSIQFFDMTRRRECCCAAVNTANPVFSRWTPSQLERRNYFYICAQTRTVLKWYALIWLYWSFKLLTVLRNHGVLPKCFYMISIRHLFRELLEAHRFSAHRFHTSIVHVKITDIFLHHISLQKFIFTSKYHFNTRSKPWEAPIIFSTVVTRKRVARNV